MKKNLTQGKATQKADPIYRDVETILKNGDTEQKRLLRQFISALSRSGQQNKPKWPPPVRD